MNLRPSPENLGEQALKIAGFQLWIHGRQFPEAVDYYDGNWLCVTAHCEAFAASVWVQGSIVMVTDIYRFRGHCEALLRGEATTATLDPDLRLTIKAGDRLGHLRVRVQITPDHLLQSHIMTFEIDQSYPPGIINACSQILEEYPIRGREHDRCG